MKNLTLVKLGGSLITDKKNEFVARPEIISRLGSEARNFAEGNPGQLVLAHGSGSFGHQAAHEFESHKGFFRGDSKHGYTVVQDVASRINRIVVDEFVGAGLNAVSIQPSAGVIADKGRIKIWDLTVFKRFLLEGFVPVPFGDIVLDKSMGCSIASADEQLFYLARELKAERILMVGNVDGVFESFPPKKMERPIEKLDRARFKDLKASLDGAAGIDVTGGMLHKVERMLEAAEHGVDVRIINGMVEGRFEKALLGEEIPGTRIG